MSKDLVKIVKVDTFLDGFDKEEDLYNVFVRDRYAFQANKRILRELSKTIKDTLKK